MIVVEAEEFRKEIYRYCDMASKEPVFITQPAREEIVVVSREEYSRLAALGGRKASEGDKD